MINLTINSTIYPYPEVGDENWGDDATRWAAAITNGTLQKTGGLFQLLGELDFGTTSGIKSLYYKSRGVNPATTGILRLANAENISWRNFTNTADLPLTVNSSNQLTYLGVALASAGNYITSLTGDVTGSGPGATATTISAGVVTAAKLAANAVTTSKILDANVTLAKLANISGLTILGNPTGTSGAPGAMTGSSANSILPAFTGDSGSGGVKGLVPAPASGDAAANKFLKSNGTWETVASAGNYITDLTGDVTASGPGSAVATIAANAVTNAKIATDAVSTSKIFDGAVTTSKIQALGVTDAKLAANSVTTAKILDANVTNSKLAINSVSTTRIQDGTITLAKMGSDSVDSIQIKNFAVTQGKIGSSAVSLDKMANLAANSIIGNNTGISATPLALTVTQATAMLSILIGDSGSGGVKGLVPAPASGDAAGGKFLKADGTWAVPAGGGGGSGITELTGDITAGPGSGSQVATISSGVVTNAMLAGSIDLTTKVTGALPIANGGTGQSTKAAAFDALSPLTTDGDIVIRTGGTNARLAGNQLIKPLVLTSTGDGVNAIAPSWQPLPEDGNFTYFWTATASDVSTYFQQKVDAQITQTTFSFSGATNGQLLRTYISNPGKPGLDVLPSGAYTNHIHIQKTSGTKTLKVYTEIWETDSAGVDIALISTSGPSSSISGSLSEYTISFSRSAYALASLSSRIATKVFADVTGGGSAPDLTIYSGAETDSRTTTPAPSVDATNFVPYTGATKDVGLGTFNITANNLSGTNTGNQTITLTGDVTGSGTGSFAATIAANAVTTSKILDGAINNNKLSTNAVDTPNIFDNAVTDVKILNGAVTTNKIATDAVVSSHIQADAITSAKINNGAVLLAKMANLAANSIIGNNTGVSGVPLALTQLQLTAMINPFTTTLKGLVPLSGGGTTNFLRADGTWAAPAGGGSTTLQTAYNGGTPQILVTDVSTGSVVIKDSATNVNRSKILDIQNNAGVTVFGVTKDTITNSFHKDFTAVFSSTTTGFTAAHVSAIQSRVNNFITIEGNFTITRDSGTSNTRSTTMTLPVTANATSPGVLLLFNVQTGGQTWPTTVLISDMVGSDTSIVFNLVGSSAATGVSQLMSYRVIYKV